MMSAEMLSSSVFIEFEYNFEKKVCTVINTNIKEERIDEVLEEWALSQINTGKDPRKANEKDIYHITIICDLRTDTFHTVSDTGNRGLTAGIVMLIWAHELWKGGK